MIDKKYFGKLISLGVKNGLTVEEAKIEAARFYC